MRFNHRLRLAAISGASAGAILAVLFMVVVVVVKQTTYLALTDKLAESLRTSTLDPAEPFDVQEFHTAYPTFRVTRQTELSLQIPMDGHALKVKKRVYLAKRFQGQTYIVSADWTESERGLRDISLLLACLWPFLTLLVAVSTWFAARAVFQPLERLTGQASTFAGSNLKERLRTEDEFEFGEFAASLNGMLDRIEEEVLRGDRFAADAAHELRTPLAILRTRIDTALLNPRSPAEYEETLIKARAEIARLSDTAEALLRTARGETLETAPLDLAASIREIADGWRERFAHRNVGLELDLREAHGAIAPEEFRIVLDNLLDNALRFSPEGSRVGIGLTYGEAMAEVRVSDEGPGFPKDLGDRAFDRLTRGDDSRNRSSGGAGIGLSVVRAIANSRGGSASLEEKEGGATVVVRLPKT